MTPISSKRIAVFPGTFDPFTLGHMSIVSRGLELLDEVVIAIGINDSKRTYFTVEQRLEMLRDLGIILGFESFRTTASPSTLRSNGMPGLFCGVSGR
jgi:cytidyltransferase-like protein